MAYQNAPRTKKTQMEIAAELQQLDNANPAFQINNLGRDLGKRFDKSGKLTDPLAVLKQLESKATDYPAFVAIAVLDGIGKMTPPANDGAACDIYDAAWNLVLNGFADTDLRNRNMVALESLKHLSNETNNFSLQFSDAANHKNMSVAREDFMKNLAVLVTDRAENGLVTKADGWNQADCGHGVTGTGPAKEVGMTITKLWDMLNPKQAPQAIVEPELPSIQSEKERQAYEATNPPAPVLKA